MKDNNDDWTQSSGHPPHEQGRLLREPDEPVRSQCLLPPSEGMCGEEPQHCLTLPAVSTFVNIDNGDQLPSFWSGRGSVLFGTVEISHDLPVRLTARYHPPDSAHDEDRQGEPSDEVPPRVVRDVGRIVTVEHSFHDCHQAYEQADQRTEDKDPRWGDPVQAKGAALV